MSRGIRDLRELICVSRLNNAHDNDDFVDSSEDLINGFLNISDKLNKTPNVNNACHSNVTSDRLPTKSKNRNNNNLIKRALPSIKTMINTTINTEDDLHDVEQYLEMIDERLLSKWLCKANLQLQDLVDYAMDNNAYVNFTNFWLVELQADQKQNLFAMEYGILSEEVNIGLATCIDKDGLAEKVTTRVLNIAFWEYRSHFLSAVGGDHLLLDYLDVFTAEVRCDKYKALLTKVRLVTHNKRLIQYVLTVRAFALVSFWSSVVGFYRNLVARDDARLRPIEIHLSTVYVRYTRLCMSIW